MNTVPVSLAQAVKNETSGETILWGESPDAGELGLRAFSGNWWFAIPWTAFAVFWTWGASVGFSKGGRDAPAFFTLWGLMFVGIGCAMLLAPLFEYIKASRTYYVVTTTRAIIFQKTFALKIRSFGAASVARFERVSRGSTGGDIVFNRVIELTGRSSRVVETGFMGLADFKSAEKAMKQMLEKAGS